MSSKEGTGLDLARATWRKPRRSQGNGACVEVADDLPGVVPVRDSKQPDSVLTFSAESWRAFVEHMSD